MTENQVEAEVIQFLQERKWIVDRNHVGVFKTQYGGTVRVGRPGQCDWRAVRRGEYLEVETKATGKTPTKEQREYMAIRTHQGIAVTWADSLDSFKTWYSGRFND